MLFLASLPLQLSAQEESLTKRITINYDGADFIAVLNQISQQTQVRFAYQSNIIPTKRTFHIHITNTQAQKAIRDVLHQQGLDYSVHPGNILVITKWNHTHGSNTDTLNQQKNNVIAGRITQFGTGERLVKASIFLPQLNLFQQSDEFGVFKFAVKTQALNHGTGSSSMHVDSLLLIVTYPGFQTHFDTLIFERDYFLNIQMLPQL